MASATSFEAAKLIRRLRREAGLTQAELAARVGTTQSVISRLESDDYEGHSLSMLYRVAAAVNRRIAVQAVGDAAALAVRECAPSYGAEVAATGAPPSGLSAHELGRLAARLVQRLGERGVTAADVEEAVRWARADAGDAPLARLRGAIRVAPGDVVEDVRRARAQRGRERARAT